MTVVDFTGMRRITKGRIKSGNYSEKYLRKGVSVPKGWTNRGWVGESTRHSMSRYGIKTGRKTLSVKKARKFAIEEKNTAKTYKSYGFPKLAKDEARHSKVFKKYVDSKNKKPAWQREIDARIKKGNGFEEISDNVLTNYPKLDNWAGREKIEKYYNKQYAKSDVQAGWF